jgi:hypothetical protein
MLQILNPTKMEPVRFLSLLVYAILFQTAYSQATTGTAAPPSATPSMCGTGNNIVVLAYSQSDLDTLEGCNTFQGICQLDVDYQGHATLPNSMQTMGGFVANGTGVTNISAPGLQSLGTGSSPMGSSLQVVNNANVGNVAFPLLTNLIGTLQFAANPNISVIDGLGQLALVGGNVDLTGDFQSVSLPNLTHVGGGINIQSSNPAFQCPADLAADRTNGVISGKGFVCAGNIKNPTLGITGANYSANTFPPGAISGGTFLSQQTGIEILVL